MKCARKPPIQYLSREASIVRLERRIDEFAKQLSEIKKQNETLISLFSKFETRYKDRLLDQSTIETMKQRVSDEASRVISSVKRQDEKQRRMVVQIMREFNPDFEYNHRHEQAKKKMFAVSGQAQNR